MKYGLVFLMLLVGCTPPLPPQPSARSRDLEMACVGVASIFALLDGEGPGPSPPNPPGPGPEPGPSPVPPLPGKTCPECDGTGKLKPDGRIEITCYVCKGSGKITIDQLIEAYRTRKTETERLREDTENLKTEILLLEAKPKEIKAKVFDSTIEWKSSGAAAKQAAMETGKPCFIFFTMQGCSYCEQVKNRCFSDPAVADYINSNFIPLKINREGLTRDSLVSWEVNGFPSFRVVRSDWKDWTKSQFAPNPDNCLLELNTMLSWANQPKARKVVTQIYEPVNEQWDMYPVSNGWYGGTSYDNSYGGGSCASGNCGN